MSKTIIPAAPGSFLIGISKHDKVEVGHLPPIFKNPIVGWIIDTGEEEMVTDCGIGYQIAEPVLVDDVYAGQHAFLLPGHGQLFDRNEVFEGEQDFVNKAIDRFDLDGMSRIRKILNNLNVEQIRSLVAKVGSPLSSPLRSYEQKEIISRIASGQLSESDLA